MSKRILSLALAIFLLLSLSILSACDDSSPVSTAGGNQSSSDPAVNAIRNGALDFYPSKTLGKALSEFLTNIKWESLVADDEFTYVNVSGGILYNDEPATAVVQYRLNDDDTFEFYAIEIDGGVHGFTTYFQLIVLSFEDEIVSIVKDGALYDYPEQTLGKAFGNFFGNIKWEVVAGSDLVVYVNVSGGILYGDEEATALLQYQVDTIDLSFIYNAFEINGVGQSDNMYYELIETIFE